MDYLKKLKIKYIKTKIKNPIRGQIRDPKALVKIFRYLEKEDKEKVISVHLNARAETNCFEVLSVGGTEFSLISPREVFKSLLLTNSTGFILIHNHPSGNPAPSAQDLQMIKELQRITEQHFDMDFVDFVIIGDDSKFWSWRFEPKQIKRQDKKR